MYWTAFLLGFMGSFHCLGMCGPIALSLQSGNSFSWIAALERFLYNFGRTFTYTLIGLAAGFLGQGMVWMVGYQVYLTAFLGIVLLLIGVFAINPDKLLVAAPLMGDWFQLVRKGLGKFMKKGGLMAFLGMGLMNGFLPCGLVYIAVMNAVATGNSIDGMLFMMFFGLGTFPLMLGISYIGKYITVKHRNIIKKMYPVLFVVTGLILIWRAYNVYTAPTQVQTIEQGQEEICH